MNLVAFRMMPIQNLPSKLQDMLETYGGGSNFYRTTPIILRDKICSVVEFFIDRIEEDLAFQNGMSCFSSLYKNESKILIRLRD